MIHTTTYVAAPPTACYDAIATAEGLDGWFTTGAEVDARPGGTIRFRWKAWGPERVTAEDGGPVLVAERPTRFVFQWSPDHPGYRTTVELTLTSREDGTLISLREDGFEDSPSGRKAEIDCALGWGEALTFLKIFVEQGLGYNGPGGKLRGSA